MNLQTLTHPDLIAIAPDMSTSDAIIHLLASKLLKEQRITDLDLFVQSVMDRENEGPTALGEELAVPHGKSNAVAQASFALAILPESIEWAGLDGNEPVRLVFLLAIPLEEAGSTHIQLLSALTSELMNDSFRNALLSAKTAQDAFALFQAPEKERETDKATKATNENRDNHLETVSQNKRDWITPTILGSISLLAIIVAGLKWAGYM